MEGIVTVKEIEIVIEKGIEIEKEIGGDLRIVEVVEIVVV